MSRDKAKYEVLKVFTPTTPAKLTFIERKGVNERFADALRTPGKQLVVYGHSGSGKTTFIQNKVRQLYEGCIISRCTKRTTFEQLVLDAFYSLGSFFEKAGKVSEGERILESVGASYFVVKTSLDAQAAEAGKIKDTRLIPPQLTVQRLAEFMGEAKLLWVLEDFHKMEPVEKQILGQTMKLFMDSSDDYPEFKIVVTGTVGTAKEVVRCEEDMRNRMAEIYMPLMTDEEIENIVTSGELLLNVKLAAKDKNDIVRYSCGLPSVCHQLCLNVCFESAIHETLDVTHKINSDVVKKAVKSFLRGSSSTVKGSFYKALKSQKVDKYNNCLLILRAIAGFDHDGGTFSEILECIRERAPGYPPDNLKNYLVQLQQERRGSILKYDGAAKSPCMRFAIL